MDYLTIKQVFESYRSQLNSLDMQWFCWDAQLRLPKELVDQFTAENRKFMRLLQKTSHPDVRAKIQYLEGLPAGSGLTNCDVSDALYPPCERCRNC